uniref:Phytophthora resistance protein RpsYD29-2 n=1 Tax=Glycine max TaxID=3847 RepID=K9MS21_SOYBN|nr:phytophthora resistance protein RpsYD29-2 [Glycine max]
MAAAVVGGAFLSAFLDVLFDRLASPEFVDLILGKKLSKSLLSEDNSDGSEVSVVPIVGMGGVGKTTLAQLVYNDENLEEIFDFKAWVCVSQELDILKVTKTITEAVTGKPCKLNDLNLLHLELMDKLKDKEFLIVLDDVWTENYVNWRLLKKPFNRGIRRSKILLTTRSEKTASIVQTVHIYHLNQLSNEDCWSVFANHACLSSESDGNTTTLEKIGKEIVKKCNGLPLAAQSLGGMLRRKHDIVDWNNILNSDIWELSESECEVIPALRRSYHYLPPHLKRCFVYCSLYPQDYEFEKYELILLWMAEDLLKKSSKGRTLEEVGHEYFDDLVSRSFFQRSNTSRSSWPYGKCFVMHDLMHDLATSLGGDFYFRSEELGKETKIKTKTRHLSFTKFNSSVLDNFDVVGRAKFLRTFLSIINFEAAPFNNEEAQCIIVSKLMYLRVLSFHDFQSQDSLPDSIEMPRGMSKLNHLQHLDFFVVGKHQENEIKELGGLSNLRGQLELRNMENVSQSDEALEARMMDKKHINSLLLEWSRCNNNSTNFQLEIDVFCKLQPHFNIESLQIKGYKGTRFPDWMGNSSYRNMTRLTLSDCDNCSMLPSLEQLPSLGSL